MIIQRSNNASSREKEGGGGGAQLNSILQNQYFVLQQPSGDLK